jgi:hypothetical protein
MVQALNPDGSEIFCTRLDQPWGPPSLLYNGYQVLPGGKAAGAWCWPPTPFKHRGHKRIELYLYPPSRPVQACNRTVLPLQCLATWWPNIPNCNSWERSCVLRKKVTNISEGPAILVTKAVQAICVEDIQTEDVLYRQAPGCSKILAINHTTWGHIQGDHNFDKSVCLDRQPSFQY